MINYTLIGQAIAFAIFVWFCMYFVWPPLMGAVEERRRKISEGLMAAEQAKADLSLAEEKVASEFARAQHEASAIIERAQKTATQMVEDAKQLAQTEGERILEAAHQAGKNEIQKERNELHKEVAGLAVAGAQKILQSEIDEAKHHALVNDLVAKL